jgi:hypothetical protein
MVAFLRGIRTSGPQYIGDVRDVIRWVTAAVVAAGGTGYAVGNTIALANGVILTVATLSGSAVATVTIANPGQVAWDATLPTNPRPQVSTSGSGSGATFNLTWSPAPRGPLGPR